MTKQELFFAAIVILFFFLLYLVELIVDRLVMVWLMRLKKMRVYFLFFIVFLMLGALFAPDFTRMFLGFMFRAVIATGKLFINTIGDVMNTS